MDDTYSGSELSWSKVGNTSRLNTKNTCIIQSMCIYLQKWHKYMRNSVQPVQIDFVKQAERLYKDFVKNLLGWIHLPLLSQPFCSLGNQPSALGTIHACSRHQRISPVFRLLARRRSSYQRWHHKSSLSQSHHCRQAGQDIKVVCDGTQSMSSERRSGRIGRSP